MKEAILFDGWLKDDDFDPFGFNPLHDPLDSGGAEVIGTGLHHQTVDTYYLRLAGNHAVGNKILTGGIRIDDSADQVVWHLLIVG